MKYDPNLPLIFSHIPKSGGTSLSVIFKTWFKDKLKFHYFDEKLNILPTKHKLEKGICIYGHFNSMRGFGIEEYYPEVKQFIMFLRDPFDIIVSRYFYMKMKEKDEKLLRDGKTFKIIGNVNEYLQNELNNPYYSPNILNYLPKQTTIDNYKEVIRSYFIFIGFFDKYQESINKLSNILGFPNIKATLINKSDYFDTVDPGLRSQFISTHALEYEVYNYSRSLFINE